ncbi:hypothetical protein K435DRAFT_685672 [Dendrothele bispora CBS 962.96]|uniref:MULE transposase domain-containing protein n=1 Tax=Dendrothele bispora (strain CBS 962.96) TaxID=1314807 RepID=A0A4S8LA60_DENBC|nr:hypothetical protein K435DRAFT_685672 [Dendrothele bispora CBS 962.96]
MERDTACSSPTAVGSDAGLGEVDEDLVLAGSTPNTDDDDEIRSIDGDVGEESGSEAGSDINSVDGDDGEMEERWVPSNTVWLDEGIHSEVLEPVRKMQITAKRCHVQRVERIKGGLPSYFPIPRVSTAFLIDLTGTECAKLTGEMDRLIADHEQESWYGATGKSDNKPQLSIFTGTKIPCRRNRQYCAGVTACERVDPSFLPIECYELDPDAFCDLVEAQINSRVQEASTVERKTTIFFQVVNTGACLARDNNGKRDGCTHFVSCSGWKPNWRDDHRSYNIPNGVDEELLIKLFESAPVEGKSLMSTCSRIVPSRVGLRASGNCKYPHNPDGSSSKMVKHKCKAYRTIFVPTDKTIRMACIIYKVGLAHSHPALPLSKPSKTAKELYRRCVEAAGIVGTTARSVEQAPSTQLILQGKSLGDVHPGLLNRRAQQKVIDKEKAKMFPKGRGLEGALALYDADQELPISERYVHGIEIHGSTKVIFTFNPTLIALIHETIQFESDGTFKRVEGEFDEYELTTWASGINSAVTIGRIYFNRKNRATYKAIYDGLQKHVGMITGQPIRFHALQKGGNIRAVGTDMELAELQGMGDSFVALNEPEHSKILDPTSEEIMKHISKICITHFKRGVHDLRSLVSNDEYNRLMNVPYLESEIAISEFTEWVKQKKSKKISDWWNHKLQAFILSGIIQCRSKMSAESWALTNSTTNINEGMHSFTNKHTGTKKSLVEAILSARKLDNEVAARLLLSKKTGILKNPANSIYDRMTRNATRHSSAARKKAEVSRLNQQIANCKKSLSDIRKQKTSRRSVREESSSSGRVPSASSSAKSARQSASPYPAPIYSESSNRKCYIATSIKF